MTNNGFTLNPRILWKRYVSKEPWFELISEEITEDGLVKIKCDWNSAFIRSLAELGFTGTTSEDYVYQYINQLARIAASRVEQHDNAAGVDSTQILSANEMENLEQSQQRLTTPNRFVS